MKKKILAILSVVAMLSGVVGLSSACGKTETSTESTQSTDTEHKGDTDTEKDTETGDTDTGDTDTGTDTGDTDTDTTYTVKYYKEDPTVESGYVEFKSKTENGTVGETVTAEEVVLKGYSVDKTVAGTVETAILAKEGTELKLYYKANTGATGHLYYTIGENDYEVAKQDGGHTLEDTRWFYVDPISQKTAEGYKYVRITAKWEQFTDIDLNYNMLWYVGGIYGKILAVDGYYGTYGASFDADGSANQTSYMNVYDETGTLFMDGMGQETWFYNTQYPTAISFETGKEYTFEFKIDMANAEDFCISFGACTITEITWATNTLYNETHANYTVEYYGVENETETKIGTDTLTGKIGDTVQATAKTIEGYTYDETNTKNVLSATVVKDGTTVLKVYYTKNATEATYTTTYYREDATAEGGYTVVGTSSKVGTIGETVTAVKNVYPGYTIDESVTGSLVSTTLSKDGAELKVYYKANKGATAHVYTKAENVYSEVTATEGKYAVTDGAVYFDETSNKVAEGYKYLRFKAKWTTFSTNTEAGYLAVISMNVDGHTVFFTDKYQDYGCFGGGLAANGDATASILTNIYNADGTEFLFAMDVSGWSSYAKNAGEIVVGSEYIVEIKINGEANTNFYIKSMGNAEVSEVTWATDTLYNETHKDYKVQYYVPTETGYELKEENVLNAKVGSTVSVTAKEIKGYVFDSTNEGNVLSAEVSKDGTTVLKVYYTKLAKTVIEKTVEYNTKSLEIALTEVNSALTNGTVTVGEQTLTVTDGKFTIPQSMFNDSLNGKVISNGTEYEFEVCITANSVKGNVYGNGSRTTAMQNADGVATVSDTSWLYFDKSSDMVKNGYKYIRVTIKWDEFTNLDSGYNMLWYVCGLYGKILAVDSYYGTYGAMFASDGSANQIAYMNVYDETGALFMNGMGQNTWFYTTKYPTERISFEKGKEYTFEFKVDMANADDFCVQLGASTITNIVWAKESLAK